MATNNNPISQLSLADKQAVFEEYFDRDIESYFTSSVICCDKCELSFAQQWPGTYSQSERLERWQTKDFIEQSRISNDFTASEISLLLPEILCPRCNESLNNSGFYVYELPFTLPDDWEETIIEISDIAREFPFLLLTHPFAKKVYETIERTKNTLTASNVKETFYRGRSTSGVGLSSLNDFSCPPKEVVSEGRYNHSGHSMLYLADSKDTVLSEIGTTTADLYIAAIAIDVNLSILDLTVKEDIDNDDEEIMQTIAASSICAAPRATTGWDRPEYVFTRFVADCAKFFGFDAIKYGSTKNHYGYNLVLLSPPEQLDTIATLQAISFHGPKAP